MSVLMFSVKKMSKSNKKKQDDGHCTSKEEFYAVEMILNKRRRNMSTEYLVKWEGYPNSSSTWEPECNLDCAELVAMYEEAQLQGEASVPESPLVNAEIPPMPMDENYPVERIINKRRRNRRMEYLVKWQGYPNSSNTWEPDWNLDCKELLAEYEEAQLQEEQAPIIERPLETAETEDEGEEAQLQEEQAPITECPLETAEMEDEGEEAPLQEEQAPITECPLETAEMEDEGEINGFAKGLQPERIISAKKVNGTIYFNMKW